MINIIRVPDTLPSLATQEIKSYLDALSKHFEDKVTNPKPERKQEYRNWDVLEAFDNCFFSKCYLTEKKAPANAWIFEIDHFIPKNEQPALVFEWANLFPCDAHTNNIRPRKTPPGGYLNPCNPADDVETEIVYDMDFQTDHLMFKPASTHNSKAINTADLLNRIHNGHDANTKKLTENLRAEIRKRSSEIKKVLGKWQIAIEGTPEKEEYLEELRGYLSRKESFTMLMRSMPIVQKYLSHLFD